MSKPLSLDKVRALAARALQDGAERPSVTRIEWDVAGKCQQPLRREVFGRADEGLPNSVTVVLLDLPCRMCDPCRARRASVWRYRALAEVGQSTRTWFGTLTLKPEVQHWAMSTASRKLRLQGVDFDALPYGEQFTECHAVISKEITRYLKRLRKLSGVKFRYLVIAEAHKNGLPHYHMLVHEGVSGEIRYELLTRLWSFGFTKWNIVHDLAQATYLCKYLSKISKARVRASLRYGME